MKTGAREYTSRGVIVLMHDFVFGEHTAGVWQPDYYESITILRGLQLFTRQVVIFVLIGSAVRLSLIHRQDFDVDSLRAVV